MNFSVEQHLRRELPSHWKLHRLKEVADITPSNVDKLTVEGQPTVLLCNYVDTYKHERITSSIDFMRATATRNQINRLALVKGDLTITKDSESPWDIAVPSYIAEDIEGLVCGYHLSKIAPDPERMDGSYLAWALRCKPVNLQFALSAQGITRYGLSSSALADGRVPCPPLPEQIAIASYLHAETTRIDALTEAKAGLLDQLAEMKIAIGLELATKGLNDIAPGRASGIAWAPVVPAHWKVKRNMFLFRRRDEVGKEGLPILKVSLHSGVSEGEDDDEGMTRVRKQMDDKASYQIVRKGDVAYNMMRAWQGAIGAVPVDGLVSPAYVVLQPTEELDARYFEMLARTPGYKKDCERRSYGIASFRWRLYWEGFKEILTPIPPIDEQRAIVASYDLAVQRIEALAAHVEAELDLLRELRTATISDAVLGRIDVRQHLTGRSKAKETVA